ncbi:hypothetical protein [Gemmobacter serpentinus]|uniref:hypothetical protein n=1 Tax=Gemmobacter serpentinus TaxID=2652247 RepID=UPI00124E17C4|nr:hypothetical protein [Gemmobacter serpentinus]
MTTPPDVKYETLSFTITGAFMIALSRVPPTSYPATVADFMGLLGDYARSTAAALETGAGRLMRAPDLPPGPVSGMAFPVSFTANPGDTSADPLGTWEVAGVLRLLNLRQGAAMQVFHNTADQIYLRLPEPQNIADKEDRAIQHDSEETRFENMPFIAPYFEGDLTSMEFVWANVGDYTTRSCR